MLSKLFIPLVNWTLGTIIMIVFGVVCLALMLIVNRMVNSEREKDN